MDAEGRDNGYIPAVQQCSDQPAVHVGYLAHKPQFRIADLGFDHATVDAAQAHGPAAEFLHHGDQFLVDQSGEDGHHYLEAGRVGNPQAAHEPGRQTLTLHPLGDHIPAAVDHHHLPPFLLQPDQVPKAGVVTSQGAATDLYNDWMARHSFLQTKKLRPTLGSKGVESAARGGTTKAAGKSNQTAVGPAIGNGRPTPECLTGIRTQPTGARAGP